MRTLVVLPCLILAACFDPDSAGEVGTGTDTSSTSGSAADTQTSVAATSGTSADTSQMTGSSTAAPGTDSQATTGDDTSTTAGADATSTTAADTTGDETSTSTGPAPVERILMFGSTPVNGNLLTAGGEASARASADALCADALEAVRDHGCTDVRALLSVNANDEIVDMPTNYAVPVDLPVEGPTGMEIDVDFAGLLDGSIAVSPVDAAVATGDVSLWSGSSVSGEILNTTCNGWTQTEGAGPLGFGSAGQPSSTTTWLAASSASCNGANQLICICW